MGGAFTSPGGTAENAEDTEEKLRSAKIALPLRDVSELLSGAKTLWDREEQGGNHKPLTHRENQ